MEKQCLLQQKNPLQEFKSQAWLKISYLFHRTGEGKTEKEVFKGWFKKYSIHYLIAE